ncbi:MAG: metallophosphoesterase family protein [Clostridia bacterium]|nr:metallophosphoesterase family protein [Clostridia bacterium]
MIKLNKKILSVFLAAVMLFASVSCAFAQPVEDWNAYWETADAKAGIIMFNGSDDSQRNFSWYSDVESKPVIRLSLNSDMCDYKEFSGESVKTYDGNIANKVTVSGLEAGKTYYYQCVSTDFTSSVYCFETDDDNAFTAMYVTDVHVSHHDDIPENIRDTAYTFDFTIEKALETNNDISLILSAGDQASEGFQTEYVGFAASPYVKSIPVATTVGNHDLKGVAYRTFTNMPNESKMTPSTYVGNDYYFVRNNVLFLIMDSNNTNSTGHRNFVRKAVKDNPDVNWKVMMFHHDLYGGRIEHRESENALHRLLWAPICDEFGIDLVLLGHSHYYTVSNVMYNNKTVAPVTKGGTVVDPNGTIYMVSGSLNRPRDDENPPLGENVAIEYLTEDKIYNLIDFTDDSLTVKSYAIESDVCFNSFTIQKTSADGGHSDRMPPLYNFIVRFIATIYEFFNNIGIHGDLTDKGFTVNFFDIVFG